MAKGNFIEYVISDNPNKYPNESEQDGYYYRKVINVETEEQTITAGTTPIEVIPSQGKLISKVNINPTPTEEKTVIPTTEDLIVAPVEGKQLSQVTVQGDANFLEENIAKGVTIWGKTGTHQGSGSGQYAWKREEGSITKKRLLLSASINTDREVKTLTLSDNYDISILEASDFNGLIVTSDSWGNYDNYYGGRLTFNSNGTLLLEYRNIDVSNNYVWVSDGYGSWTFSNGTLNITHSNLISSRWGSHVMSGSKYITKSFPSLEFVDFVVSDDSSTYPSSGQHTDGYYYSSISQ